MEWWSFLGCTVECLIVHALIHEMGFGPVVFVVGIDKVNITIPTHSISILG